MSTATFSQQEAFREERRHQLGGSDVPNFFNIEPYYCERRLGYFKIANPDGSAKFEPDFPFYGNKATERGQIFERFAAELYSDETNRDVRKAHPVQDPEVPELRPQPDFEIINNARGAAMGRGILSIKVPGREMYMRLKQAINTLAGPAPTSEWGKQQAEAGKQALLPYELQLQAEIGAQKVPWGSFGLANLDAMEIKPADYDRDEGVIAEIRGRARDFWQKRNRGDIDAFPRLAPESKQCRNCEFRLTCQASDLMKMLKKEEGDGGLDLPVLPILDTMRDELRVYEGMMDEAKELVDGKKDEIRQTLADVGVDAGEAETTRVYNRLYPGKQSFQKDPMLKYLKELAGRAEKALGQCAKEEIVLPTYAMELINTLATMPEMMEKKFVKTGAPYRVLKVLDIRKNLKKGTETVQ